MQINFKSAENNDIEILLSFIQKLYALDGSIPFNAVIARNFSRILGILHEDAPNYIMNRKDEDTCVGGFPTPVRTTLGTKASGWLDLSKVSVAKDTKKKLKKFGAAS